MVLCVRTILYYSMSTPSQKKDKTMQPDHSNHTKSSVAKLDSCYNFFILYKGEELLYTIFSNTTQKYARNFPIYTLLSD